MTMQFDCENLVIEWEFHEEIRARRLEMGTIWW